MGRNRIGLRLVGALAGLALVAGMAAAVVSVGPRYEPDYDRGDPDYGRLAADFDRLHQALRRRGSTGADTIDLAGVNGGRWKIACVFGGYTDPSKEMRALGAIVSADDQRRLGEAGSRGMRLAEVEEHEILVAYVDSTDRAHFIHFDTGIGPDGQGLRKCVSAPETRMALAGPAWSMPSAIRTNARQSR